MNLPKAKTAAEPKVLRKGVVTKGTTQEASQQHQKKVSLTRPVDSPRKESFKAKVTLATWSGKKRLSAVRDDQSAMELRNQESDIKKPSQSTDSVEAERPETDNFREYGFADLLVRHKSAHGDISYRTSTEYFYKKPDRQQNIQRLGSPQLVSVGRKKPAGEPSDQQIRRMHVEEATKENSVNKEQAQHGQQTSSARSISTVSKHTELASTAPQLEEAVDQRLGSVSVMGSPIGGSSNSLHPHNRPIVFDIRSSTTLSRQLAPNDQLQRQKQVLQPLRDMKKPQPAQINLQRVPEAPQSHNKAELSGTHNTLQAEYGELKTKYLKYERILGEKQKQINKLELENHNAKVEVKNSQLKITAVEEEKQKLVEVHSASEAVVQQLRNEVANLRKEASLAKNKQQQDLSRCEKEVKEQYGQLIHDKNNQIAKLNLAIREKQAEIDSVKQEMQRLVSDLQKAGLKESQLEKLVEYYRKETKMIGVQIFNLKKKLEVEAKGRTDADAQAAALEGRLHQQAKQLADIQLALKDKEKQMADRLKQSQHEKNLLYDSLTASIRNKEAEIAGLRRETTLTSSNSATSLSSSTSSMKLNVTEDKQLVDSLKRQIEHLTNEIAQIKRDLSREMDEKQKLAAKERQLNSIIVERQKRDDEERSKQLYQSQSQKTFEAARTMNPAQKPEIDRLTAELAAKANELQQLAKTLKTCQQRCSSLESLLSSTNEELFVLRLQGLCKKLQPY